jgi:hypothetical protein
VSLLGLTGQSSTPGLCLLDRPVKPGDDSKVCVNLSEKRSSTSILKFESYQAALSSL